MSTRQYMLTVGLALDVDLGLDLTPDERAAHLAVEEASVVDLLREAASALAHTAERFFEPLYVRCDQQVGAAQPVLTVGREFSAAPVHRTLEVLTSRDWSGDEAGQRRHLRAVS